MFSNSASNKLKLPLPAYTIVCVMVLVMLVGICLAPLLSVQLQPSAESENMAVHFNWPNASPQMVEKEVTAKIEGILCTVRGVKNIRSVSSTAHGMLKITLHHNVNKNQVRYEVATLLRQLYQRLPQGVSYPTIQAGNPSGSGSKVILTYTLNGSASASSMQRFAENNIKPQLARIKGVYDVNVYGAGAYNWELRYKPEDLYRCQVTARDIATAVRTYFATFEQGKISTIDATGTGSPEYHYITLACNRPDPVNWNDIPVKKTGNRIVHLTDVVKVSYVEQAPGSYYRINGLNAINIEIVAAPKSNYLMLAAQIKERISELKNSMPPQVAIMPVYDATGYIRTELNTIGWRSLAAFTILLATLLAISKEVKFLLLILISLAANLLMAFVLYYFFKLEIHLYSLAAITVSMGMIIDNSIVVIDHIRHRNNMRVLQAVAGTTFTTIGAVCIVFFLDEHQQAGLRDFAWVIIVNMSVSLLIALFFIPALMEKLPLTMPRFSVRIARKRRVVKWNRLYASCIRFTGRFRIPFLAAFMLIFGLPVFMLPQKCGNDNVFAKAYNATIGTDLYNESIRPGVDKALGGTLRLFLSLSDQFQYANVPDNKTKLTVDIRMPQGAVIKQMNQLVIEWEHELSKHAEIEQFETKVFSGQYAGIEIVFKKQYEKSPLPYLLKRRLETKAVYTGLAEFNITGMGPGFNNELKNGATTYALLLQGYNYNQLQRLAEKVKHLLEENVRTDKVTISGERDWQGDKTRYQYVFRVPDRDKLLVNRLSPGTINNALRDMSEQKNTITDILNDRDYVPVVLSAANGKAGMWDVMNRPVKSDSDAYVRLKEFAYLNKEKADDRIIREDQQYQLVVNYDFIGDSYLASIVTQRILNEVNEGLPLGYTIKEAELNFWKGSEKKLVWAILITIGIVMLVCAIVLNNFFQALAVVCIIPISFIGVFVMAYVFRYRFDEGGYAAFIILSGVVVNAALYILNDYNSALRAQPARSRLSLFLKAYNSRIIPVLLSILSMLLGLLPFIVYAPDKTFWYAMAMSVTGGLIFSIIAILIVLPLLLRGFTKTAASH